MSKENKFRVVDNRGSEPVIATVTSIDWSKEIICYVNEYNEEEVVPFKEAILLGYTGLKDKKRTEDFPDGQEIFEEDIFKGPLYVGPGGFAQRIGVVEFHPELGYQWNYWLIDKIEVIGNRHQNPELLENKQ